MRKPRSLPRYVSEFADRHGKMRVRFRRKGQEDHYFRAVPWTQDFMLEYHACLNKEEAPAIVPGIDRSKAGTFNALISSYYGSPDFKGLKERTKNNYRNILERFRDKHGEKPVSMVERRHIKSIIGGMSDTPEAANSLLKRLKTLFTYAIDIDMLKGDPIQGLKGYKSNVDGHHTWTEEEIEAFEIRHPIGSKAWLAYALMIYTGQRRSDAVRMSVKHIVRNKIKVRQLKTSKKLLIPIHILLKLAISDVQNQNKTFLVAEYGKPFTAEGFGNWFRDRCDEAGLRHCSAHGLRKAASRRLAEAGCSNSQIKAITGHTTDKEVARYIADADQNRMAEQAMEKTYGMSGEGMVV